MGSNESLLSLFFFRLPLESKQAAQNTVLFHSTLQVVPVTHALRLHVSCTWYCLSVLMYTSHWMKVRGSKFALVCN
ncbi:hypothetical protein EDB19DRAFT_718721 [Suillus lakei]|nr:hypothetical protein EDB19DRAFT_718721 [Suillus lakei]